MSAARNTQGTQHPHAVGRERAWGQTLSGSPSSNRTCSNLQDSIPCGGA